MTEQPPTQPPQPLAAAASTGEWTQLLTVIGALIAVAILAAVVFLAIRRHTLGDHTTESEPLTLGGLRDLLKRGEITQQEYDQARAAIIASHAPHLAQQPTTPPDPNKSPPQNRNTNPSTHPPQQSNASNDSQQRDTPHPPKDPHDTPPPE